MARWTPRWRYADPQFIAGNHRAGERRRHGRDLGGGAGVSINGNPNPATGNIVGWDGVGDPALMRNLISGSSGGPSAPGLEMVVGAYDKPRGGQLHRHRRHGPGGHRQCPAPRASAWPGQQCGRSTATSSAMMARKGAAARNVISGNTFAGIDINGANGTHDNAVVGNSASRPTAAALCPTAGIGLSMDYASARTPAARNWFASQPTPSASSAPGSFGGGAVAYFLNGVAPITGMRCWIRATTACSAAYRSRRRARRCQIQHLRQQLVGAASPTAPARSNADASVATTPWLTAPAAVCDDTLFRNGFEAPAG